jgi:hypothetical protein
MNMTTVGDLFPSKFLKADDVEDADLTLTMKELKQEKMGPDDGEGEMKPVLYFNETEKGLVLNVTNAKVIQGLYGKTIEKWVGQKVVLFWTEVGFKGEMKPAIRIHTKVK